jgi:predicted outer membrane repeat protein
MTRTLTALALALAAGTCSAQTTITVPDDVPTLTLALNPAVSGLASGDTIVLRDSVSHAGTFTVTTPDITIREAAGDTVVIDAFGTGAAFTVDAAGGPVTFEGLTIQNGANPGSNGAAINVLASGGLIARDCNFLDNSAQAGGAIYSTVSSTTLEDCTFTGNSTTQFGGAVRTSGGSALSVTITGCTFTDNHALSGNGGALDHAGSGASLSITNTTFSMNTCTASGGAVFATQADAVTLTAVDFLDNVALGTASQDTGGAILISVGIATVRDCDFERNLCAGSGGALRFSTTMGNVIDSRFTGNEASSGGAIQVVGAGAGANFYNCIFDGNSARRTGSDTAVGGGAIVVNGGFPEIYVYNSLFTNNTATTGGAITAFTEGEAFVFNSTFVDNDADALGGAVRRSSTTADVVLNSCIVHGNLPVDSQIAINGGGLDEVNYSLVEGGYAAPGVGNIDANPMFVDASNGDYSLLAGSPAIDAGSSDRYIGGPLSDLGGSDRGQDDPDTIDSGESIIGAVIDMGAFEFNNDSGIPDCPADQNFDGMLSPTDFTAWINNFNNGCD